MLVVLAGASYDVNAVLIKEKTSHVTAIKLTAAIYTIWAIPALIILYVTGWIQNFEMTTEYVKPIGCLLFLTIFGTAFLCFIL